MLMSFIVHVRMGMHLSIVKVFMLMTFGHVQPKPQSHKSARQYELVGHRLIKSGHGDDRAEKWSRREVCGGACSTQMSQREHKQREANAVAEKAHDRSCKSRNWTGQGASRDKPHEQID